MVLLWSDIVCSIAFDIKPNPLNNINPLVGSAVDAIDLCINGTSILKIVGTLGLPGINSSQFDLQTLAGNQIDGFDFSAVSNFNLAYILI
jgi:hypothetical protein